MELKSRTAHRGEKDWNILLAEDNDMDVKVVRKIFEQFSVQVKLFVAADGQEALDYLYGHGTPVSSGRRPNPDIILLDLNMPRVGGMEVLKKLKSDEHYRKTPVIILTSSENSEDVENCYRLGANSYLIKPGGHENFKRMMQCLNYYWFHFNRLPAGEN